MLSKIETIFMCVKYQVTRVKQLRCKTFLFAEEVPVIQNSNNAYLGIEFFLMCIAAQFKNSKRKLLLIQTRFRFEK